MKEIIPIRAKSNVIEKKKAVKKTNKTKDTTRDPAQTQKEHNKVIMQATTHIWQLQCYEPIAGKVQTITMYLFEIDNLNSTMTIQEIEILI